MKIIPGKIYIVTGGSGFLGVELIKRIVEQGGLVKTIARNEGNLLKLKTTYGDKVEIYPGDISDAFCVAQLMAGGLFEGVFHLAAFKHVPLAEKFSAECINSNVIGSVNVLHEAVMYYPKFIIGISTDKAAQVAGVYGASKLLMESMFRQLETICPEIIFRIVRYGNVLYSTGSVLCKWKELIQQGKGITMTDPDATRFFWTIDQAIDLIFDCLENATDAKPYVPSMKAMSMGALLEAMVIKYAPEGVHIPIGIIGLQAGENKHEKILEAGPYSNEVPLFTVEEITRLI